MERLGDAIKIMLDRSMASIKVASALVGRDEGDIQRIALCKPERCF